MQLALAIAAASLAWFVVAAVCFFNPLVDPLYRAQEGHAAVRSLPQRPSTIGKILLAVLVQVALWALVYRTWGGALPGSPAVRGLMFAGAIAAMKIVPRDIDRVLLTTYPLRRLGIELVVGLVCAIPVGLVFSFVL